MYCNKKLNVESSNQEIQRVNPLCPNINMLILHTTLSLYFSCVIDKEKLFKNHKSLKRVVISCVLITLKFHSVLSL